MEPRKEESIEESSDTDIGRLFSLFLFVMKASDGSVCASGVPGVPAFALGKGDSFGTFVAAIFVFSANSDDVLFPMGLNAEMGGLSSLGDPLSRIEFVCTFATDRDGSGLVSFFISGVSLNPHLSALLAMVACVSRSLRMFLLLLNSWKAFCSDSESIGGLMTVGEKMDARLLTSMLLYSDSAATSARKLIANTQKRRNKCK